jgi:predicted ATPase with chaperone activity
MTFDLALASAVLSANGKKAWERLEKTVLLGELALDGRVRPVKGVLPAVPGQRGALLWFRTGSDVVVPNAFRLLSIPTTA